MKITKYETSFNKPKTIRNSNLLKILQFYLFECPAKGKSHRGKTFNELGYIGSLSFSKLKKELMSVATPSLAKNYMPSKKEELQYNLKKCETIYYPDEYCIFLINSEGAIDSLFSSIRNALAHGSFNVKSYNKVRIYYFSNYKGYEKARIVLHEDTLLSWIKIITH